MQRRLTLRARSCTIRHSAADTHRGCDPQKPQRTSTISKRSRLAGKTLVYTTTTWKKPSPVATACHHRHGKVSQRYGCQPFYRLLPAVESLDIEVEARLTSRPLAANRASRARSRRPQAWVGVDICRAPAHSAGWLAAPTNIAVHGIASGRATLENVFSPSRTPIRD